MTRASRGLSNAAAAVCITLLACHAAHAQEVSRFGVVVGYPSSIGVEWQVSDPIAIRPSISFRNTHTAGPGTLITDAHDLTAGLSLQWCLRRADDVDFYVSPRLSYVRTTSEISASLEPGTLSPLLSLPISTSSTLKTTGYEAAGLVGARYTPSRHFSVFGESGIAYSHTSHDEGDLVIVLGNTGTSITSHSWSTTAGVGAVVWF